jgi:hypothetical protein
MAWTLLRVSLGIAILASCTYRETHARCETFADCSDGQECYLHYCVSSDVRDETATQTDATPATEPTAPESQQASSESAAEASDCQPQSTQATEQEGACCEVPASCYDGPAETLGVGACQAGSRECVLGRLGVCSESVVPSPESCSNKGADDDCDGQVDEIAGRGQICTLMSGFGPCGEGLLDCVPGMDSLTCVRTGPPVSESCNDQDDDCDGQIDEGFDISSDSANCGSCGQSCASAELCCGGACLELSAASESGCPSCSTENPCAEAALCCGGACRDLQRDRRHCGACGHSCEQGERCCDGTCKTSCE